MVYQIRNLFNEIDVDHNETIEWYEFHEAFTIMGINITEEESRMMFRHYDLNNNDEISFPEFQAMIEEKIQKDILIFDDLVSEVK